MERAAKIFEDLCRDLGIERKLSVEIIRSRWCMIMGETIALHSVPSACDNDDLIVSVDSPEWLHELHFHQEAIRKKISPFGFRTVRFRLGVVPAQFRNPSKTQKKRKLTEEDRDFIESSASVVPDEETRKRIRKAMARSLSSKINRRNP